MESRPYCPECRQVTLIDGELCPQCTNAHAYAACRLLVEYWEMTESTNGDQTLAKAIRQATAAVTREPLAASTPSV